MHADLSFAMLIFLCLESSLSLGENALVHELQSLFEKLSKLDSGVTPADLSESFYVNRPKVRVTARRLYTMSQRKNVILAQEI